MATSEQTVTQGASIGPVGARARRVVDDDSTADARVGPDCHQCGHALDYVGAEPGDRGWSEEHALRTGSGKRTVIEHVRCPSCGAGGARVKLAANDRVVRKFGPATRSLRGRSASARDATSERQSAADADPASAPESAVASRWSE